MPIKKIIEEDSRNFCYFYKLFNKRQKNARAPFPATINSLNKHDDDRLKQPRPFHSNSSWNRNKFFFFLNPTHKNYPHAPFKQLQLKIKYKIRFKNNCSFCKLILCRIKMVSGKEMELGCELKGGVGGRIFFFEKFLSSQLIRWSKFKLGFFAWKSAEKMIATFI